MSETDRLARFLRRLGWAFILAAALWLVRGLATGHVPFRDRVDPETGTAGLLVETDAGTGCQYIVTPWGGIVPRTGHDGKPICDATRPR